MSKAARTFLVLVVTVVVLIAAMQLFTDPKGLNIMGGPQPQSLAATELLKEVKNDNIKFGKWQLDKISGEFASGKPYEARVGGQDSQTADLIINTFDEKGVKLELLSPPPITNVLGILSVIAFPLMIGLMIWFLVLRPAQMGGNQALNNSFSPAVALSAPIQPSQALPAGHHA